MAPLVPLLVAVPLGAAFCVVAMAHIRPLKRLTSPVALAAVLACLATGLALLGGPDIRIFVGGWGPHAARTLGIELVCDGLARFMVVLIDFVSAAALLFAGSYIRRFREPGHHPAAPGSPAHQKVWMFEALFLLMVTGMNGVVLTGDLFNMFVFLEIAAISSYALVGFGCEAEELEAAFKYLVLGSVGSAFFFVGVTILYALTGNLNMQRVAALLPKVGATGPAALMAAGAFIGGLALKAAMVPFHAWLPDAHPSAPAPISAMLSGVLIKASGIYAMARIIFNVFGPAPEYAAVFIFLGAASMILGMLLALGQRDLKRLLAYSSISQAGYIVVALGVAVEAMAKSVPDRATAALCLFGGLFHLLNHATFKSLLFLSSGAIEQQAGTRDLMEMGGLVRQMPVTSFCCRIGALSIAGVPPFNGFFSKLFILLALAAAGHYALCAIAAGVAVGTLLMYVKVQRYALEGPPEHKAAGAREAPATMCIALVILAIVCLVAGLAAVPLREHLLGPAGEALMRGTALTVGAAP